ncbi:MAG TPA: DinB family protein [Acidobacteriota bacterium]|nr:DinB family protein [Acidobacteriota bacterium]
MSTPSPRMSSQEHQQVMTLLQETRQDFLKALQQVAEEDWNRCPREGSWTPAQLAQHVVLAETAVLEGLLRSLQREADPQWQETLGKEELIIRLLPARRRKAEAPPHVRPREEGLQRQEAVRLFEEVRARTLALAQETERPFKQHTRVHPLPAIGKLNGHQWLLFNAQHLRRHILQLEEMLSLLAAQP